MSRARSAVLALVLLPGSFLLTGCATIMTGTTQNITVMSTPPGASIVVDGKPMGRTPAVLDLGRGSSVQIVLRMEGYQDFAQTLSGSLSGPFMTCDLPLLLVGIGWLTGIVDLLTGAAWTLKPEFVNVALAGPAGGVPPGGGQAPPVPVRGKYRTIAVAEFDAQGVSSTDAAVIAEMLRNRLLNVGGFTVIEKKNMEKVLSEQAFQQSGCTSQECAVKLGKLLNAQGIVVGTFGKLLGRYLVSVRLVDVETGQAVVADEAKGDTVDEIEKAVDGMVARMSASLK